MKAAQAQFVQARAAVGIARSDLYPTVTSGAAITANHLSARRPLSGTTSKVNYRDYDIPIDASREPDIGGRVRRSVEASRSEAQASAADLASVSLSLHAELALDYFELCGLDAEKKLLDSTGFLRASSEAGAEPVQRRAGLGGGCGASADATGDDARKTRTWKCSAPRSNTRLRF